MTESWFVVNISDLFTGRIYLDVVCAAFPQEFIIYRKISLWELLNQDFKVVNEI